VLPGVNGGRVACATGDAKSSDREYRGNDEEQQNPALNQPLLPLAAGQDTPTARPKKGRRFYQASLPQPRRRREAGFFAIAAAFIHA